MTQPRSGGHSGSAARRAHYLARIAWLRTSGMSALLVLLLFVVFMLPALIPFGTVWHVATDICSDTDPGFRRRGRGRASPARDLAGDRGSARARHAHRGMVHATPTASGAARHLDAGCVTAARHRRRHQRLRPRPCNRRPVVRRNRGLPAAGIDLGRPVLGRRGPFSRRIFRAPRRDRWTEPDGSTSASSR